MHYIIITCYIYQSIADAYPLLSNSSPHLLMVHPVYTNKAPTLIMMPMTFPLPAPTGFHLIYMVCTKIIKHFVCVGIRKELGQHTLSG